MRSKAMRMSRSVPESRSRLQIASSCSAPVELHQECPEPFRSRFLPGDQASRSFRPVSPPEWTGLSSNRFRSSSPPLEFPFCLAHRLLRPRDRFFRHCPRSDDETALATPAPVSPRISPTTVTASCYEVFSLSRTSLVMGSEVVFGQHEVPEVKRQPVNRSKPTRAILPRRQNLWVKARVSEPSR
jgi:hypothetical protein